MLDGVLRDQLVVSSTNTSRLPCAARSDTSEPPHPHPSPIATATVLTNSSGTRSVHPPSHQHEQPLAYELLHVIEAWRPNPHPGYSGRYRPRACSPGRTPPAPRSCPCRTRTRGTSPRAASHRAPPQPNPGSAAGRQLHQLAGWHWRSGHAARPSATSPQSRRSRSTKPPRQAAPPEGRRPKTGGRGSPVVTDTDRPPSMAIGQTGCVPLQFPRRMSQPQGPESRG